MTEVRTQHVPTMKSYVIGFSLSIVLTLLAFGITYLHISSSHVVITHEILIPAIIGLAFVQLLVQLFFFLHLGRRDQATRWNLVFFISTFSLVLLVVAASIWIMNHLNYNMMPPKAVNDYILQDEGIQPETESAHEYPNY